MARSTHGFLDLLATSVFNDLLTHSEIRLDLVDKLVPAARWAPEVMLAHIAPESVVQ
jgi:hypothetical protein